MVDAKSVQDYRLQIVHVDRSGSEHVLSGRNWVPGGVGNIVSVVVRAAVGESASNTAAGEPDCKTSRMMIAAIVCGGKCTLRIGCAAKLAAPHNERVIEHAALLQV